MRNAPAIARIPGLPIRLLRALPGASIQRAAFRTYHRILRLLGPVREGRTYFDAAIECDLGDLIQMCIYHFGIWEPHISALIESRLGPGDFFCDVGANIGYHALLAAKVVGSSGEVIAIEASPGTFERLLRNLHRNHSDHVKAVPAAVVGERGTVALYYGEAGNIGTATTLAERGHGFEATVPGMPLADILSAGERRRLRLIKIDVEGAELPILEELADAIEGYSDRLEIIAEFTADEHARASRLFDRLQRLGFAAWAVPNSYDIVGGYVNFRRILPPTPLTSLPPHREDIFFSRSRV